MIGRVATLVLNVTLLIYLALTAALVAIQIAAWCGVMFGFVLPVARAWWRFARARSHTRPQ